MPVPRVLNNTFEMGGERTSVAFKASGGREREEGFICIFNVFSPSSRAHSHTPALRTDGPVLGQKPGFLYACLEGRAGLGGIIKNRDQDSTRAPACVFGTRHHSSLFAPLTRNERSVVTRTGAASPPPPTTTNECSGQTDERLTGRTVRFGHSSSEPSRRPLSGCSLQ